MPKRLMHMAPQKDCGISQVFLPPPHKFPSLFFPQWPTSLFPSLLQEKDPLLFKRTEISLSPARKHQSKGIFPALKASTRTQNPVLFSLPQKRSPKSVPFLWRNLPPHPKVRGIRPPTSRQALEGFFYCSPVRFRWKDKILQGRPPWQG